MSLRVRLSIIVSILFCSGLVLGMSYLISNAKQRVADEIESTAKLTYQLLNSVLSNSDETLLPQDNVTLLKHLLAIEDARHMDISIQLADDVKRNSSSADFKINAPAWFVHFVQPESLEFRTPINNLSQEIIVIRTNPADEIAEVWLESKSFMIVLLLVLLVLNSILYISIGHWFRPVNTIIAGLDDVERGDFSGHIPKASLPELKVIAEKINRLTSVLRASREENNRLAKRSLMIQEEERRYLAQELHDEMGQSISAIKVIAFSISERMKGIDQKSAVGANKIGSISNHVRDHVRSMMSKLRPTILDELGLVPALQHMVDEWNEHHGDTFCSLKISDDYEALKGDQKIYIYRIVQEALTNVARHANASEVNVDLSKSNNEQFHIIIADNGKGFELKQVDQGLGLSGIKERSLALDGHCEITSSAGNGVRINVSFVQK